MLGPRTSPHGQGYPTRRPRLQDRLAVSSKPPNVRPCKDDAATPALVAQHILSWCGDQSNVHGHNLVRSASHGHRPCSHHLPLCLFNSHLNRYTQKSSATFCNKETRCQKPTRLPPTPPPTAPVSHPIKLQVLRVRQDLEAGTPEPSFPWSSGVHPSTRKGVGLPAFVLRS